MTYADRSSPLRRHLAGAPARCLLSGDERSGCMQHGSVVSTRKFDHITPVLRNFLWLPIRQRIQFKLAMIVFKCLDLYISRSTSSALGRHHETVGSANENSRRRQSVCSRPAVVIWNSLPTETSSIQTFSRKLKTFYTSSIM